MNRVSDLKHLYAPWIISCLLHAAFVFAPLLSLEGRPSGLPSRDPHASSILSVRLPPDQSNKVTAPEASSSSVRVGGSNTAPAEHPELNEAPDHPEKTGLLSLPGEKYFTADQLTKHPHPRDEVNLEIPETRLLTASGTVVLKLWIDNFGEVVSIDVEKTELPEAFARAVAATFRKVRFAPGEINARPVGSVMRIEIAHEDDRLSPP